MRSSEGTDGDHRHDGTGVLAKQRAQRLVAADILNAYGAEFIGFYGRWAWQGLTTAPATADAKTTTVYEGRALAKRPEQIPSLFAYAWNERNPDALASLFDEDAEFVNGTGCERTPAR